MDPQLELLILRHVQVVSRHFLVWRGDLKSLIAFVAYSIGPEAPAPEVLDLFLRKEEVQRELSQHYETALFRASDKTFRLICLCPPTNPATAKRRLNYKPVSPTQCAWCLIDEKRFAETDLVPLLNLMGEPITGFRLHPACLRPYRLMMALADSAETEER